LIERVRPLLNQLTGQGYYVSDRVVERAAREAGEAE
jgi:predicted nucleic acid-binding protein